MKLLCRESVCHCISFRLRNVKINYCFVNRFSKRSTYNSTNWYQKWNFYGDQKIMQKKIWKILYRFLVVLYCIYIWGLIPQRKEKTLCFRRFEKQKIFIFYDNLYESEWFCNMTLLCGWKKFAESEARDNCTDLISTYLHLKVIKFTKKLYT